MKRALVFTCAAAAALAALAPAFVSAQPAGARPAPAAAGAAQSFDPHNIDGVWMQERGFARAEYTLTPEYQTILQQRIDAEKAGKDLNPNPCVPGAIVRMMTLAVAPIEFARVGDKTYVVTKENGSIYRIHMDRPHLDAEDLNPGIYGDAVGRWEGDTLVVDHIGLGGSDTIEGRTPHSDVMHVVQRIRRISADRLENQLTIDDPKALAKPTVVTVTYKSEPKTEMGEFFCTNERMYIAPDGKPVVTPVP